MSSPVVDAHVHLFPPEVITRKETFCARDAWFDLTHGAWPVERFPQAETLLESMDAAGIVMAVIAGWPWQDVAHCRFHNDWLAELAATSPRLAWLGIVNPVDPEVGKEIQRVHSMGAVGLGEMNADAQGFDWERERDVRELAEVATTLDVPVMAHVSEPLGREYPGKGTATPRKILAFLEQHPDLRFVAAHWGGGLPFYELMPDVGRAMRNVTYDTAASTYLYRPEVFDIVVRIVGAERVVWGSDFPVLGQRRFLDKAVSILGEADARLALGCNAVRVYGLQVPEVAT
jgi:uncharacterized protein